MDAEQRQGRDGETTHRFLDAIERSVRSILESSQGDPLRPTLTMQFEEVGVSFPSVERPDINLIIARAHTEGPKSSAFADLVSAVRSDPRLAKRFLVDAGGQPIPDGKEDWWLPTVLLQPMLTEYVKVNGSALWNDSSYSKVIEELVSFMEHDTATFEVLAPLDGFTTDEDYLDLDGVTAIRRWGEAETISLFEDTILPPFPGFFNVDDLIEWTHIAVERFEVPIDERPLPEHADSIGDVVSALRLLHDGWVGARVTLTRRVGPWFGLASGMTARRSLPLSRPTLFPRRETYVLNAERETNPLRDLFLRLRRRTPDGVFDLALRRFHSAYERDIDEDKIIDYWVALEAMFLPDAKQELSYRASLRVSRFLGATPGERRELFQRTKKSYDTRSRIVHGVNVPEVQTWTIFTEDLVRRSLVRLLDPERDHSIDAIDAALLE